MWVTTTSNAYLFTTEVEPHQAIEGKVVLARPLVGPRCVFQSAIYGMVRSVNTSILQA